jgi:hypothetical protein
VIRQAKFNRVAIEKLEKKSTSFKKGLNEVKQKEKGKLKGRYLFKDFHFLPLLVKNFQFFAPFSEQFFAPLRENFSVFCPF